MWLIDTVFTFIVKKFTNNSKKSIDSIITHNFNTGVVVKEVFNNNQLIKKETYKKNRLINKEQFNKTASQQVQDEESEEEEDYIPSDELPFEVTQIIHGGVLDIVVRALSAEGITSFSVNDKNCQLISSSSQPLSMEKEFILEQGQTMIFTYRSEDCNARLATIDTVGDSWDIPIVKQ